DEETVEEYIEHVYAWVEDEKVENERGELEEPDDLKMKVFEIEHLGRFTEDDYGDDHEASNEVEDFRENKIVTAMNLHAWQHRTQEFEIEEVNPKEIPVIKTVLASHDWDDVKRIYEDNMVEMFDYSQASAELTSRRVMEEVSYRWD
ncbi:MAG: kinase anchor protein, partial [Halobacteria archaeon]|nr:kinase anchor protein [Halobacteria archaeon]